MDGDGVVWDMDDINGIDDDGNGFIDDICGWDFANGNNDPNGPYYHGTHVAGIVAAQTNNAAGIAGIAGGLGYGGGLPNHIAIPGARLMAIGVGDYYPDGSILDDAILYAASKNAKIITLSLTVGETEALNAAITAATLTYGVFIDCAAGNGYGPPVHYPARHKYVYAVSATDQNDNIAVFSSYGDSLAISAPGVDILSTQLDNTYNYSSGTSFAAPHIAGVAALILSHNPSFGNFDIEEILAKTADKVGSYPYVDNPDHPYSTWNEYYGYGRVNAWTALPPRAPTGLSGVWEHISKDWADITLHWNPNSESDLSGYYVYRSTSSSGPFSNVGTVEPLEAPVFVDRVYAWRSYWYYVTAFDILEKESDPSDTIRVDPEYYPGPCPFVFTWNGSEFAEDNNIIAGSDPGEVVTDAYKLTQPLLETDPPPRYRIEIREEKAEHSFFDGVTLRTVDHPDDVEVGISVDGEIVPVATAYTPVSAISEDEEYADVFSDKGLWFEGCAGDTMVVEFGAIEETDDKELWLNSDRRGYPISIEIERGGYWEYVTSVFPRGNFSTIPVVSLSELIGDGEALTFRLVWFAEHNLKTIRIVRLEDISIEENTAPLTSAIHSRLSNVKQELLNEDEEYAEVLPGDTITLEFAVVGIEPEWVRDFVFVSNGYYITETGGGSQTAYSSIPIVHSLSLYPNPTKNDMNIRFGVPREERVSLKIYDISGREIKMLVDNKLEAGYHTVRLDCRNLPSGIYFARLVTDNYEATKKLVLMK